MSQISAGLKDVILTESKVCRIDGEAGELIYRGYNIHDLAEHASFEEVIHLLLKGKLPNSRELTNLQKTLTDQRRLPPLVLEVLKNLPKSTEPMAALRTAVSALAGFDPNPEDRSAEGGYNRILSLISQIATLVASFQRLRSGEDLVIPQREGSHAENFLYLLRGTEPDPTEAKALDIALTLHADHGLNASTFAARVTTSTLSDVYSALTTAIGTLKGPLHGGANQKVMEMLLEIGDQDPTQWVEQALKEGKKIMGFGHRVYRTEDPRATHLRRMSEAACRATGNLKFFEMSKKIEEYMVQEKSINANVDFYSATLYHALGIPTDLFTLIFAMSRASGWGAHILEQQKDNRLIRPRAKYIGAEGLHYQPIEERK